MERALGVLRCFTGHDAPLSASDIARRLGLPTSTAHRLARTLRSTGFLDQDDRGHRYRLGPTVIELGLQAYNDRGLPSVVPELGHLAHRTRATADLAIRSGDRVVIVARGSARREHVVGLRRPLHSTALGKVLLAWARPGDADLDKIGPLRPLTSRTITAPATLATELDAVRRAGYAVNDGESAEGIRTVAVPVLDRAGHVRFALAVRATPEIIPQSMIPWVLARSRECVAALQVHLLPPEERPTPALPVLDGTAGRLGAGHGKRAVEGEDGGVRSDALGLARREAAAAGTTGQSSRTRRGHGQAAVACGLGPDGQ